jgi:polysaccharide biosynthesis protein PslH
VPIAIDTREIAPIERRPDGDRILHIGTLLWPPNADGLLWFLNAVLPLIRRTQPHATVDIVGTRPPRSVTAAAARHSGVSVHGFVPDLSALLQRASVLVIPLRAGAGMRVRILNGLAQGMPIVTTTVGCEGIDVVPGEHLLVADTAEQFAAATVQLLAQPDEAATLGQRGRALIVEKYDIRAVGAAIDAVYEGVRQA